MDFRRKSRLKIEKQTDFERLENQYPHNVMLYIIPPIEDIKLKEFQELALERVVLLRIFDHANTKGLRLLSDEWKEYVNGELNREGLKGYLRLFTGSGGSTSTKQDLDLQARRRDYLSHFILRLAYCTTQENRNWFKTRETEVFKYKFSSLTNTEIKQFLDFSGLNYTHLNEDQKNEVKNGLYESTSIQSISKVELLDFYKVPFTEATELVRFRRCFLKEGFAYVSSLDLVSIIALRHENEIDFGLQSALRFIRDIQTDERLDHMLKSLHNSYIGKDYTAPRDSGMPIEMIDELSKKSFPLCMRACHEHLRAAHHHKHAGRMQYGLFLKGIGVSEEDSVRFWREEFTKLIDIDKFIKQYEYNIHHNYGKRGSMINYSPFSCQKIISEAPGLGEVHGCPYKTWDQAFLKEKLSSYGLSPVHIEEVMSFSSRGHYQLACSKFFQITHSSKLEISISHPNQYFEESQNIIENRESSRKVNGESKILKVSAQTKQSSLSILETNDDSDELWKTAEDQESEYIRQQADNVTWEDEIDINEIKDEL